MTTQIALLIATLCASPNKAEKRKCIASVRTCVPKVKVQIRKDDHIVFHCWRKFLKKGV